MSKLNDELRTKLDSLRESMEALETRAYIISPSKTEGKIGIWFLTQYKKELSFDQRAIYGANNISADRRHVASILYGFPQQIKAQLPALATVIDEYVQGGMQGRKWIADKQECKNPLMFGKRFYISYKETLVPPSTNAYEKRLSDVVRGGSGGNVLTAHGYLLFSENKFSATPKYAEHPERTVSNETDAFNVPAFKPGTSDIEINAVVSGFKAFNGEASQDDMEALLAGEATETPNLHN